MKNFNRALTPKQKHVLDFIVKYIEKREYAPSLEEIGKNLGLAVSTVHQHVSALKNKGYLKREVNQPRGVLLPEQTPEMVEIPLFGIISAGLPVEPLESPDQVKVPKIFVSKSGNYYALKVKGDSMIDDGIWDGDIIVVKHQQTAISGDTVIAVTENGVTLKRYREQNGLIFLEPRNINLKNIYPKNLEIRGKFIGLIRNSNN